MPTQTTEGTGPGSVDRVKSRILNGDVKDSNLSLTTIINGGGGEVDLENVSLIKATDGTADSMDGEDLVIRGGEAYTGAGEEDTADGGNVVISGGMQHGDGNSGDVLINGGDSSADFFNSDAGDVILRGGDGLGAGDSDGGDVTIRGGDCEVAGSRGDGGDVTIRGGNSVGEDGGNIVLHAGDSGSSDDEEEGDINNNGGAVTIHAGNGGGPEGMGGNVEIQAGYGDGGHGRIVLNSMVVMPVFSTMLDRDGHPSPTNGMVCYVVELNALNVYANGAWRIISMEPAL